FVGDTSITYWARAIGAAHLGNLKQAKRDAAQIEVVHKKLLADKKKEFANTVEQDRQEVLAWIAHAQRKDEQAIKILRGLADKEIDYTFPAAGPVNVSYGLVIISLTARAV